MSRIVVLGLSGAVILVVAATGWTAFAERGIRKDLTAKLDKVAGEVLRVEDEMAKLRGTLDAVKRRVDGFDNDLETRLANAMKESDKARSAAGYTAGRINPKEADPGRMAAPPMAMRPSTIGVAAQPLTAEERKALGLAENEGLRVHAVQPGSPAEAAGVAVGDIITGIDGKPVGTPLEIMMALRGKAAGEAVGLALLRDGKAMKVAVTPPAAKFVPGPDGRILQPGGDAPMKKIAPPPEPQADPKPMKPGL